MCGEALGCLGRISKRVSGVIRFSGRHSSMPGHRISSLRQFGADLSRSSCCAVRAHSSSACFTAESRTNFLLWINLRICSSIKLAECLELVVFHRAVLTGFPSPRGNHLTFNALGAAEPYSDYLTSKVIRMGTRDVIPRTEGTVPSPNFAGSRKAYPSQRRTQVSSPLSY